MNPETPKHLNTFEGVVREVKRPLAMHQYPDDLRTVLVMGFTDQMIEHHEATLLLIRSGKVGSAFALARSIFESAYRGLWVNFCAEHAELKQFEKDDKLPIKFNDMALAIDQKYNGDGFFEDFKNRAWPALCSDTHTGMLQLGRRFNEHKVEPTCTDGQIYQVTTTMTTCIIMLAGRFLAVQNHAECKDIDALVTAYGPLAESGGSDPGVVYGA